MRKIVAIGGGDLAAGDTLALDELVVRLTEKSQPRALFIPTASRDSPERCEEFEAIYGQTLGCQVQHLLLAGQAPDPDALARQILGADLIYVGGGNTLYLLERWRELGVDWLLRRAAAEGKVLAGMSAGANCWFQHGLSDAQKFYFPEAWNYLRVRGLGMIAALGCPHYHSQGREEALKNQVAQYAELAVALDDHAALVIQGERFRIAKSQARAMAYRVYLEGQDVVTEVLEESPQDRPLLELLTRGATPQFRRLPRSGSL